MGRILCVDDDPRANLLKRKILEKEGHHVDLAVSVDVAVEKLVMTVYDVVITDWRLGRGETARRVIQAARLQSGTLVILVSGFTADAFQSAAPAADLYLSKPVDPAELVMSIATLLKQRASLLTGT